MLFVNLIQAVLDTGTLGRRIEYYPRLESTNSTAWSLFQEDPPEGTVVACDQQTAGRGRGEKRWFSSPGRSLTYSVLLKPGLESRSSGLFPLLAGLAVARTLQQEAGLEPRLKWPNDILLEGKKAGGILCESRIREGTLTRLVMGIGLNVNATEFPGGLDTPATSLKLVTGRSFQRELLLAGTLNHLEKLYLPWQKGAGTELITVPWMSLCGHLNARVHLEIPDRVVEGIFTGLTPGGEARLQVEGRAQVYPHGSITILPPDR